jgi:hypothetical protein
MVAGGRPGDTSGLHGMPGGGGGDQSASVRGEERMGRGANSAGGDPGRWDGGASRGGESGNRHSVGDGE